MKKVSPPASETFARIRVIGLGGSGKNATNHMVKMGVSGVEFIVANTDAQDLQHSRAEKKVHLGKKTTQGLGTGMNPTLGRTAAEESLADIHETLKGSDLVFIACGMGGGTGTGAAPVIAKTARDLNILTVAVVTKPFTFEGGKRRSVAEEGLEKLSQNTDAIVIIPNDNILAIADDKTTLAEAFTLSDNVLHQAVSGISQLIMKPGDINIDFADIQVILKDSGVSLLGIGNGRGTNRAELAVTRAVSSPLLETSIKGAKRVLFSIASKSRSEISMREVQTIAERIAESVDPEAKIIFGTSTDKDLRQGEIQVTLIATAFEPAISQQVPPEKSAAQADIPVIQSSAVKATERLSDFSMENAHTNKNEGAVFGDDVIYEEETSINKDTMDQNKIWKKLWNGK